MKQIHLALHEELIQQLDEASTQDQITKSDLIRLALHEFLHRRALRRKSERMRQYAEKMGDHSAEFTSVSDRVVVDQLLKETEW